MTLLQRSVLNILSVAALLCLAAACGEAEKEFECEYSVLLPGETESATRNETSESLAVHPSLKVIRGNLERLTLGIEGEGKFDYEKSKSELITKIEKTRAEYSPGFVEMHNSIIQILCDIDRELHAGYLDEEDRKERVREKKEKREQYFQFLMNYFGQQMDEQDPSPEEPSKEKTGGKAARGACEKVGIMLFIPFEAGGAGFTSQDLRVNGKALAECATCEIGAFYPGQSQAEDHNQALRVCPGRYEFSTGDGNCRTVIDVSEQTKRIYLDCM